MSEIYCIVAKVDCWCNVDPEIALIHVEVEREKGLTYVIEKAIDMCNQHCVSLIPRNVNCTMKFKPDIVKVYQIDDYNKNDFDVEKDFKTFLKDGHSFSKGSYREIWSYIQGRVTDVKRHMRYSGITRTSGRLMTARPKNSPPNSGIETVSGLRETIWRKSTEQLSIENLRKENMDLRVLLTLQQE